MESSSPGAAVGRLRLVIADGRALFRTSLVRLLTADPSLDVVAEAANADEMLWLTGAHQPHVAMVDPSLPGGALEAVRLLRNRHPTTEVLLYGLPADDDIFVSALQAGVKGFADEGAGIDYLVGALHAAAVGEVMVSPRLARHIASAYAALIERDRRPPLVASNDLTRRELAVLEQVAAGLSNRRVAETLGLSEHTVRAHLRSVSRKLGAHNRLQAVREALRLGLVTTTKTKDERRTMNDER